MSSSRGADETSSLFVDAFNDLAEYREVLRLEIVSAIRAPEVETVAAQVALGAIAVMADPLRPSSLRLHCEGWPSLPEEPGDHLIRLVTTGLPAKRTPGPLPC